MEEIVVAINNLAESMSNTIPGWISVVGIFLPIVLTGISIILSVRMDKNNQKLQKVLANRDMMNQIRQCVLDIYNSYYAGAHVLGQADGNVAEIFTSDQSYYRWATDLENASKDITNAYNHAKLLVEDQAFLRQLKEAHEAFSLVNQTVKTYICTGIPAQTVANSWGQFSQQYPVQSGNYYALFQNRSLAEVFIKLCENTYTKDIQSKITAYFALIENEQFDNSFKTYVRIKEL